MPDAGRLQIGELQPQPFAPDGSTWSLPGARWLQITFELDQDAALDTLPAAFNRPSPCYARLLVAEYPESPVGPFREAVLTAAGRFMLTPKNHIVDAVVDGADPEAVAAALGSPRRAGAVTLERNEGQVRARIGTPDGVDAALELPDGRAIQPMMLRFDPTTAIADIDGPALIQVAPEVEIERALLGKRGALTIGPSNTDARWERFRSLLTITTCYVEGDVTLASAALPMPKGVTA